MRLLLSYELLQNYPESLFKDVLDYNSNLWKILDLNTENNCGISRIILYNAIQNYNNLCRVKEEQNMIPQELSRLLIYWKNIKINIKDKLNKFNNKHDDILLMVKYFLFFYLLFL